MTSPWGRSRFSEAGQRVLKFSMIGGIGIAVQLAVLAIFIRWEVHYLLATAIAVSVTLVHNFIWHQTFTWADRPAASVKQHFARLYRFFLSNGAISLAGNLLLMRLFVGWLKAPPVIANIIAVSMCSLANLAVSDRWVFPRFGEVKNCQAVTTPYTLPGSVRSAMSNSVRCAKGT